MKKFLTVINKIKNKVNEFDIEFRYDFDTNSMKYNPFLSNQRNIYIWVEKIKNKLI